MFSNTSIEDINFSFQFNSERSKYADEITKLIEANKPFMMMHKNSVSVFIPDRLTSFFSGGGEHELNAQHVQRYTSLKAMAVSAGMLVYSCKGVVSTGTQLKNNLKLIK